jgi:hypothetical protein
MSEYEYQNPQFIDITEEFKNSRIIKEIQLAPNFDLEDAVSSVDVIYNRPLILIIVVDACEDGPRIGDHWGDVTCSLSSSYSY